MAEKFGLSTVLVARGGYTQRPSTFVRDDRVHVSLDQRQVHAARAHVADFGRPGAELPLDVEIPLGPVGARRIRIDPRRTEVLHAQQRIRARRETSRPED